MLHQIFASIVKETFNPMKSVLTGLILLLTSFQIWAQDGALTPEEKSEIAQHLQQSFSKLEQVVSNLSTEQWHYKPVDSVWSIAEISEHLEKSEKALFGLVSTQLVNSEPQPEKEQDISGKTQEIMSAITSRDHRLKTRPDLEPTGKYKNPQQFLDSFKQLRESSISYATSTEDELRHHFIPFGPLGDLDGYQILMFMSGHLERHIQQIEEVMSDPEYPST